MLLGPIVGTRITPQRPASDGLGNLTFTDLPDICNAVFSFTTPTLQADSDYTQGGSLFVPRGSDLRNGDRVKYQGRVFVVIGEALWDMDHPFTGEDFGYVEFGIQWGAGRIQSYLGG